MAKPIQISLPATGDEEWQAVHMLGYYRDRFGLWADDYLAARACDANTVVLSLHNRMTAEDYQTVVAALRDVR